MIISAGGSLGSTAINASDACLTAAEYRAIFLLKEET
jgi:hypothetical protein